MVAHCHRREDRNESSGFTRGRAVQRRRATRLQGQVRASDSHGSCPAPHAATQQKHESAASLGWVARGRARLGVESRIGLRRSSYDPSEPSPEFDVIAEFFYDRSLDRPRVYPLLFWVENGEKLELLRQEARRPAIIMSGDPAARRKLRRDASRLSNVHVGPAHSGSRGKTPLWWKLWVLAPGSDRGAFRALS